MRPALLLLLVAGCGAPVDGNNGAEFSELIGLDWNLAPGTEQYICRRMTLTEDVWIGGFEAIAPLGTHHTVIALEDGGDDATFACDATVVGSNAAFASGVHTGALRFPEGVATRLAAGRRILLNLHVFNAQNTPLSGHSGVAVKRAAPPAAGREAELVLVSNGGAIPVPSGASEYPARCTMADGVTLFTIWPHMHRLGRHLTATASTGGMKVPLFDGDFTFTEQPHIPLTTPLPLLGGDTIDIVCRYENDTGKPVPFGESSDQEMCVFGLYRYPAVAKQTLCRL